MTLCTVALVQQRGRKTFQDFGRAECGYLVLGLLQQESLSTAMILPAGLDLQALVASCT